MTLSHQKLKKESIIDESFTISSEEKVYIEKIDKTIGLDVENSSGEEVSTPQKEETPTSDVSVSTKSLLDRCSAFLVEEDGSKANTAKEPLYKLQNLLLPERKHLFLRLKLHKIQYTLRIIRQYFSVLLRFEQTLSLHP